MPTTDTPTRVALPGFNPEPTELVREMEEFGWTFRSSNHGVVGRAPDGKTTISVGRKSSKSNRAYQNASAVFKRWLKASHPEMVEVAQTYIEERAEAERVAESDPITAEIMKRRTIHRTVEKMAQIDAQIKIETETESAMTRKSSIVITAKRPWHPKFQKDGTPRVTERVWSDGRLDYICTQPDCGFTSTNPRSVTQHYGAAHTTNPSPNGHGHAHEDVSSMIEPEPILVMVEEVPVVAEVDPQEIVRAVQEIVSQPLMAQIKILQAQSGQLTRAVADLVAERDAAIEDLTKIQQDLDALRSLVASIGVHT